MLFRVGLIYWCFLLLTADLLAETPSPRLYGVLQSTFEHADEGRKAGWNVVCISLHWDQFEPVPGKIDLSYVARIRTEVHRWRELGYRLQLDPGMQYPPVWLFELPDTHFVNQFGEAFQTEQPGERVPNYVFSGVVRKRLENYLESLFAQLGSDWDYVRLGGGKFGEVNYPAAGYRAHRNCYWAFDDIAQGRTEGLPEGIPKCPVPGWSPGTPTEGHRSAALFLEWYLSSLRQYHDWQITTVRRWFPGDLCMLYGSWGIRPGQIEEAIAADLNGSSPAEQVGEISTGYDWKRVIAGITDPKVIVYCTWIDAPEEWCKDGGEDQRFWSPVHWQSYLAQSNPQKLRVWGENTGRGTRERMRLSFLRMQRYGLLGILWAFESELFAQPNPANLATFADFAELIGEYP